MSGATAFPLFDEVCPPGALDELVVNGTLYSRDQRLLNLPVSAEVSLPRATASWVISSGTEFASTLPPNNANFRLASDSSGHGVLSLRPAASGWQAGEQIRVAYVVGDQDFSDSDNVDRRAIFHQSTMVGQPFAPPVYPSGKTCVVAAGPPSPPPPSPPPVPPSPWLPPSRPPHHLPRRRRPLASSTPADPLPALAATTITTTLTTTTLTATSFTCLTCRSRRPRRRPPGRRPRRHPRHLLRHRRPRRPRRLLATAALASPRRHRRLHLPPHHRLPRRRP